MSQDRGTERKSQLLPHVHARLAPSQRKTAVAAVLSCTILLAAASGLSPVSTPRPALAAEPGAAPPPPSATVKLGFIGDILLAGTVGELTDREGALAPWEAVKDILRGYDLVAGNLECAVGSAGSPLPGKTWTFRADARTLGGMREAGVDVVSLANNHTLDYGTEGLLETVDLVKKAGIGAIGAGATDKAARVPYVFEKNGIKVGILATTVVVPSSSWKATAGSPGLAVDYWGWYPDIVASIKELSKAVDVVVVLVHWGEERTTEPVDWVMPISRAMKEAGAHAIIGSHPHVLEGIAYDGRALTAYSLGNFVFSTRPDIPACQVGGILELTVSKGKVESVSVVPTEIVWGKTVVAEGAAKSEALETLSALSRPFGADVSGQGDIIPLLFTDMNDHWARFTVGKLGAKGFVRGYEDGSFRPENKLSKGEFAAMLSRMIASTSEIESLQEPEGFALCTRDEWSYPYLRFLAGQGIVPAADPSWTAEKDCSRLDACLAIWKCAVPTAQPPPQPPSQPQGAPPAPPQQLSLPPADTQGLDPQALNTVTWAVSQGILKGDPDGALRLREPVTRAESAEILLRYLESRGK
jgi:poly-gamma-glutamate synthesis protein (capsule biosynthesis protein)